MTSSVIGASAACPRWLRQRLNSSAFELRTGPVRAQAAPAGPDATATSSAATSIGCFVVTLARAAPSQGGAPSLTQTMTNTNARRKPAPLPPIPADAIIVVPVKNLVLFPNTVVPITIGRPKSIAAAQQALREQTPDRRAHAARRRRGRADREIDMHRVGTHRQRRALRHRAPDGTAPSWSARARSASRSSSSSSGWPFLVARIRAGRGADGAEDADIEAALSEPAPPDPGGAGAAAAGAGRARHRRPEHADASRTSPTSRPPTWTSSRTRSRRSSRPSTTSARQGWTASRACSAQRIEVLRLSAEIGEQTKAGAGPAPARGAAARADGGDPEAARRGRRGQGRRNRGAQGADRQGQDAEGGRRSGAQGSAPAGADVGRVRPNTA